MGLIRTLQHLLTELLTGAQVALLLLGLAVAVWFWHSRTGPEPEGLPVLDTFTDIYLQGFDLLGELAGPAVREFYDSDVFSFDQIRLVSADALPFLGRPMQKGEEVVIGTTWKAEKVLAKLERAGFSKGKMKGARRFVAYIDQHKELAVRDMYESKVFASVKLAQALLESNAGRSRLARESGNHFGIKARPGSRARQKIAARRFSELRDEDFKFVSPAIDVYNYHDDHRYDRFEVYRTVGDSYRRHTQLLTRDCRPGGKGCYAWIWHAFPVGGNCDIREAARTFESASGMPPEAFYGRDTTVPYFAAAAAGLKMAGYATSPTYHQKLWQLIETYELYRFDQDLIRALAKGLLPTGGDPGGRVPAG